MNYSQAAQESMFPTKVQAIVSDAIDGLTLKEYTQADCNLINPSNIRFVSRISRNRVCLYLANKDIVNEKVKKTKVKIGDSILEIRPLISKHQRIIISNVCSIIPHWKCF